MNFEPIGTIRSCFKEKFGIPRQAGLVKSAEAEIRLPYAKYREAVDGLDQFSHIWVVFAFHQAKGSKLRVRPPRMGGAKKLGVFATRSPHRPNPIGLSAVELLEIIRDGADLVLRIRGVDLLDGTPVLDIKPYVRYADAIPRARSGWASESPKASLKVSFSAKALQQIRHSKTKNLKRLITEILRQDPRPAFQKKKKPRTPEESHYAFRLHEFDVHWEIESSRVRVLELEDFSQ